MPRSEAEIEWLHARGIRRILSFERLPRNSEACRAIRRREIEVYQVLVPDCEAPTFEQAEEILDLIRESLEDGMPLLFHCYAGVGRTGVAHGLYLMEFEGLEPRQAEKEAGVETRSQAGFLMEWAAARERRREGRAG